MKFSLLALVTLTCVLGVYCQTFGTYSPYYYPYYYPYGRSRNNNILWMIGALFFLALLFPSSFGPLGSGLQNFAGALTGRSSNSGNSSSGGTSGGNIPPIG